MATTVFDLQGVITLDDSKFKKGLDNSAGGLRNLGSNIQSTGKQITKFGIGASLAMAPVALFLKSSISAFRDFDVAMVNSQTILGATNDEMEILRDQVLTMGSETGLGPQATADAFFTIVSGVQDATTHMDILQSSIRLAEAGLADLSVTTDGMVAVMNSYKFAAEDASFVSDVFTRTVQTGVGTMDEFVGALAPLASLSNELGISFQELAANEAFLTKKGRTASAAATELQSIMVAFLKPNQDMVDALQSMGFESGQMAIETLGLQGAVDALSTALNDDATAMSAVLGRAEAIKGGFTLASDEAEAFGTTFGASVDGATEAAADLQNATDRAIGEAFMAKLDALKIVIGGPLSNAIASVQTELMPFIDSIKDWAQENPETVKQIAMLAGGLVLLAGGLVIVGGLVTALGAVVGALTSPFVLGAGALVLFGIAIGAIDADPLIKQLDKILEDLIGIRGAATGVIESFGGLIPNVANVGNILSTPKREREGHVFIPQLPRGGERTVGEGFADGGRFSAFQPITVGDDGPEQIIPDFAGTVIPNGQDAGGNTFHITVVANSEAEGEAAGRGLRREVGDILVRNG